MDRDASNLCLCSGRRFLETEGPLWPSSTRLSAPVHGEKFGGLVRPTRRTDALNTQRAAQPLFSRICGNHYSKPGEPLRELLVPAFLSRTVSSVWGNQWPNVRVDVTLNQCSQNVNVNGPHHGPYQPMASSSLHCYRLVEWGRHNELEASMVGAVYVHVLRTLH